MICLSVLSSHGLIMIHQKCAHMYLSAGCGLFLHVLLLSQRLMRLKDNVIGYKVLGWVSAGLLSMKFISLSQASLFSHHTFPKLILSGNSDGMRFFFSEVWKKKDLPQINP
jgi:hypothetical protein